MFFFRTQDGSKQIARNIIGYGFTVGNRCFQIGNRNQLEFQIAFENFFRCFADKKFSERLQVRQAVQKQDAFDQTVRMFHFVDRFMVLVFAEFLETPVLQHLCMQKILVDRDQFVVKRFVQMFDDFAVAFHGIAPENMRPL